MNSWAERQPNQLWEPISTSLFRPPLGYEARPIKLIDHFCTQAGSLRCSCMWLWICSCMWLYRWICSWMLLWMIVALHILSALCFTLLLWISAEVLLNSFDMAGATQNYWNLAAPSVYTVQPCTSLQFMTKQKKHAQFSVNSFKSYRFLIN